MKLFRTNNMEIVKCCQYYIGFKLPSKMLAKRTDKFEKKIIVHLVNIRYNYK